MDHHRSITLRTFATIVGMACLLLGVLAGPAAAASWTEPVDVSMPGVGAGNPHVAVDATGDAVAVWVQSSAGELVVEGATRAAGGNWTSPTEIGSASDPSAAIDPQVAVDAAGDAVVVWVTFDGLIANSLPAGGSWTGPVVIGQGEGPQLAVDGAGAAIVAWTGHYKGRNDVESASRPANGSWEAPEMVSRPGGSTQKPRVGIDAAGDAVAIWDEYTGLHHIEGGSRPAGGEWGEPVSISAPGERGQAPDLAVDAAGDAVAIWRHSEPPKLSVIRSATMAAGGSWRTPVNASAPGRVTEPMVGIDGSGHAVGVWERNDGTDGIIKAATMAANGSWNTGVSLSESGRSASAAQLAVDPAGDAVVVWERPNSSTTVIQASAILAGGSWEPHARVSPNDRLSGDPDVAIDPAGEAVAVWYHGDRSVQSADYAVGAP
jgi:hypothetical protein